MEESKHLQDQVLHDEARRLLDETQRLMSPSRDAGEARDGFVSEGRGTPAQRHQPLAPPSVECRADWAHHLASTRASALPASSSSFTYSEAAAHGRRVLGEMDAMLAAPDGALPAEHRAPFQQALSLLRFPKESLRLIQSCSKKTRCGGSRPQGLKAGADCWSSRGSPGRCGRQSSQALSVALKELAFATERACVALKETRAHRGVGRHALSLDLEREQAEKQLKAEIASLQAQKAELERHRRAEVRPPSST